MSGSTASILAQSALQCVARLFRPRILAGFPSRRQSSRRISTCWDRRAKASTALHSIASSRNARAFPKRLQFGFRERAAAPTCKRAIHGYGAEARAKDAIGLETAGLEYLSQFTRPESRYLQLKPAIAAFTAGRQGRR